jgi:hydrogenase nickel incorporation protein HypA/HybF
MHEMSIAMAVVQQVEEAPPEDVTGAVECVRLQVGELAGVVPDALRFSFSLACRGTVLEGAELLIDSVAGRARCTACAHTWATGMPPRLNCPQCDGSDTELLAGRELRITALRCSGARRDPVPSAQVPEEG